MPSCSCLIGLEVVAILKVDLLVFGFVAIPIVLAARAISVGLPMLGLGHLAPLARGSFSILVLGGVRGGISIALALSVPAGPYKELIVMTTYVRRAFFRTHSSACRRHGRPSPVQQPERRSIANGVSAPPCSVPNANGHALGGRRLRRPVVIPERNEHVHFGIVTAETAVRQVEGRNGQSRHLAMARRRRRRSPRQRHRPRAGRHAPCPRDLSARSSRVPSMPRSRSL